MNSLIITKIFLATFGLIIGSFLNALIYRLPRELPFGLSRSACPECKHIIGWYLNIPIFSYLFLKGRCAYCKKRIPIRYIVVELLVLAFTIYIIPSDFSLVSILYFLFYFLVGCFFIVHFFIDLEHKILPNNINILLGLIFIVDAVWKQSWVNPLMGFCIGLGFPLLVTWIFYLVRGKIGLGGGDIKLFAVLGIYLGPMGIILNIFLSCFLGSIIGIALMALRKMDKENPMPFGPSILIIATLQIFFPNQFSQVLIFLGLAQ